MRLKLEGRPSSLFECHVCGPSREVAEFTGRGRGTKLTAAPAPLVVYQQHTFELFRSIVLIGMLPLSFAYAYNGSLSCSCAVATNAVASARRYITDG